MATLIVSLSRLACKTKTCSLAVLVALLIVCPLAAQSESLSAFDHPELAFLEGAPHPTGAVDDMFTFVVSHPHWGDGGSGESGGNGGGGSGESGSDLGGDSSSDSGGGGGDDGGDSGDSGDGSSD